jgi:uncharacterized protein (TIGR02231 family)
MKTLSLITLSFLCFTLGAQHERQLDSKIDKVTVFEEGFIAERTAEINLLAGKQSIVFRSLPYNLSRNSIQIESSQTIDLSSISFRNSNFESRPKPPEYLKLQALIDNKQIELSNYIAHQEALLLETKILDNNISLGGNQGFTLNDLQQISAYAKSQKEKNSLDRHKTDRSIAQTKEELQKMKEALEKIRSDFNVNSIEVILNIDSEKAVTTKFIISYAVPNSASWQNTYELHYTGLGNSLEMLHKGQVYQSTHEDWTNIQLVLATGSPNQSIEMPRLQTHFLSAYNSNVTRGARAMGDDIMKSMPTTNRAYGSGKDSKKVKGKAIAINEQSTRLEFVPLGRHTIKRNGNESLDIRSLNLEATYEYQSTPKLDPYFYLIATVTGWEQHQLLPGEINLFNEGLFIGSSYMDFQSTEDSIHFSLGKDPSIMIRRKRVFNKEGKSFFGGTKTEEHHYKISLKHRKSSIVNLRVFDHLPISTNEDISVQVIETTKAKYDKRTGLLEWGLELAPGAEAEFNVAYELRYPEYLIVH